MKNKLNITLLRPAGNDTALIEGIPSREEKRVINQMVMERFTGVEQVGFYTVISSQKALLEMAGGEFCGNALRSLAYLLLKGKVGERVVKVSGVEKPLSAGVKRAGNAYAQMPIIRSLNSVQKIDTNIYRVNLSGIVHLIATKPINANKSKIKVEVKSMLQNASLLNSVPAAGVMFLSKQKSKYSIVPVVWVRDIQTLVLETACASGSTAVGLLRSYKTKDLRTNISIQQPSSECITVQVERNNTEFISAFIDGPVQIIAKETINFDV